MTEPDYQLLARFLKEYEQAGDRPAVLQRWSQDYPRLATEFTALVEAEQLLGLVRPGAGPASPDRLGDFRLVRQIAGGGMGIIHEAVQEPFQRRVAVKTIRQPQLSEQARARFFREQAVLARLHQTHIVPIYAAGCTGDTHYFAMPYIAGISLQEVVRGLRQLPPGSTAPTLAELAGRPSAPSDAEIKEPAACGGARRTEVYFRSVAGCMADVAEAIAFAHAQGIMHRDLKPANLMIDGTGHVWVLDFGLAGFLAQRQEQGEAAVSNPSSDLSIPGATTGTLDYMAPEQLEGSADDRTDVWGVGTVLYELLTLRRAFAFPAGSASPGGETPLGRQRRELRTGLVAARTLASGLSRDLEAICLKCLQPDSAARYATAGMVADDLRRYLREEETLARPHSTGERLVRWARRHPAHASLTALAATLLLLMTLVAGHVAEVRAANARQARKLARSVERQLRLLQDAVRETANPERKPPADNLVTLLKDFGDKPLALQQFLQGTKRNFESGIKWFRRPGEEPAFVNWFVMSRDGEILTDSSPWPVRGSYRERDYARPLWQTQEAGAVYLSRVFRSEQDNKYKFAAAIRVEEGGKVLGMLAATVAIDSRLVALDLRDEPPGALVVGPMDWSRNVPPGSSPPDHVVVLCGDYDGSGLGPLWVDASLAVPLRRFEKEADLRDASVALTGDGNFVDYARVGDSHFVVMLPHPYPRPLNWVLRREGLWYGAALGVALVCFGLQKWWSSRRRRLNSVS